MMTLSIGNKIAYSVERIAYSKNLNAISYLLFARKAFTLVEIMVSVAVLGIGLTLVSNSYLVALRGINAASNNVRATVIARQKLAEAELESLKDGSSVSSTSGEVKQSGKLFNYFYDTVEISQPDYLAKYFFAVCMKVSWQDQKTEKNVILSTYLSKKKDK